MSKLTIAAGTAFIAASLLAGPAQAMPAANLANASAELANAEKTAWVCGPYRCWWRPNYYYAYNYYPAAPVVVAPRVVYPAWGWGYRRAYWGPRWYGGWGYRRAWW
jgi:hypothetical protein